jgi:hypothetical protein
MPANVKRRDDMCFGPSKAEKAASNKQRELADDTNREEIEERAVDKREDIEDAVSKRVIRAGKRGGAGRRSLFTSGGGGFLGRFG